MGKGSGSWNGVLDAHCMVKPTETLAPYKDLGENKCQLAGGGDPKHKWLQGVESPFEAEKKCDEDPACMGYSCSGEHTLLWMEGPLQKGSDSWNGVLDAHCMVKV